MVAASERPLLAHTVARILGVSTRNVRYLASKGTLPAFKIGEKIWAFRRGDVLEFMSQRESFRPYSSRKAAYQQEPRCKQSPILLSEGGA